MSSYRQHLYHLVFRTKHSLPTIKQDQVYELYPYITGTVKNMNSQKMTFEEEYRKILLESGITPDEEFFP